MKKLKKSCLILRYKLILVFVFSFLSKPLISNEIFEIWGAGIILDYEIFNKVKKLIRNGPAHLAGLKKFGITIHHRKGFKPVHKILSN